MALRAGYYGLKKSMLDLINSLVGAKIIKTIGDGLNLTTAGKLNMTAATDSKIGGVKVGDGLTIENGVLSTDAQGLTVDTLFTQEPGTIPSAIELSHPYTDYKLIVFGIYETENVTYNDMYGKNIFLADQLETVRTGAIAGQKSAAIQIVGWEKDAHYAKYTVDSTTVFTRVAVNAPPSIIKVYGIK